MTKTRSAVAVYSRITQDRTGEELGVKRQLQDRRAEAELDMNMTASPRRQDELPMDEMSDSEMHMQTVIALVPLRNPDVGERRTAQ
jgi:hypothetical protein